MTEIPDKVNEETRMIERLLGSIPDAQWNRMIGRIDYEVAKALPELDLPRDICDDILCVAIGETAPVLIDHGRQQEREKWEARIEAEATKRSDAARDLALIGTLHSVVRAEGEARALRSLITEGESDE